MAQPMPKEALNKVAEWVLLQGKQLGGNIFEEWQGDSWLAHINLQNGWTHARVRRRGYSYEVTAEPNPQGCKVCTSR
jgi:hypothetical protein